jgi:hypothetical protein
MHRSRGSSCVSFRQRGVTYLWMLFLVFLLSLGLGKSLEVYSTQIQREKEAELIYVGGLYRDAIRAYYQHSQGTTRRYPRSLLDLTKNSQALTTTRYLRKLYQDPVSAQAFSVIYAEDGGIKGVYSPSLKSPIKKVNFPFWVTIENASTHYRDWQFIYEPQDEGKTVWYY